MRGHWIGGTRKLNKHWQNGEGHKEYDRWFTTIKRGDDYYCFAPSYAFTPEGHIKYMSETWGGYIYPQYKNVWTTLGTWTLTPDFNDMTANDPYTLEDVRENGVINTQNLTASSRVKVIIPTFKLSVNFAGPSSSTLLFTEYYHYDSTPSIPANSEILWQTDSTLLSNYAARYDDSLHSIRNSWKAWDTEIWGFATYGGQNVSRDYFRPDTDGDLFASLIMGYYDYDTSVVGIPNAINLLSPVMQQLHTGDGTNQIMPFNSYYLYDLDEYDYGDGKYYERWYKLELISLDLQERTIV